MPFGKNKEKNEGFPPPQSYSLVCGGDGGGVSSPGLLVDVDGWGAAAKPDYKNGGCAFKTQVCSFRLRGAASALSPHRCTTATLKITQRSCRYISDNKGK